MVGPAYAAVDPVAARTATEVEVVDCTIALLDWERAIIGAALLSLAGSRRRGPDERDVSRRTE